MALTWLTIVTDALRELRVLNASDPASGEDADFALSKAKRLLDNWNAERRAVYANVFSSFTLTPSLSPHLIGPTGTWVVAQRPVSIEGASLVLTNIGQPITRREASWWRDQALKTLTSALPTDLYYEPAWPNGKLWFWPIPTTAYPVELEIRQLLASAALKLTDDFSLPPGYQDAITLTLAEDLAGPFKAEVGQVTVTKAREARERIFDTNDETPRLVTHDAGMPGGSGSSWFDYRTGLIR